MIRYFTYFFLPFDYKKLAYIQFLNVLLDLKLPFEAEILPASK